MRGFLVELGVLLAAFFGVTLLAEALGAANTGIAASFGVMAFAVAVVVLLVRRP